MLSWHNLMPYSSSKAAFIRRSCQNTPLRRVSQSRKRREPANRYKVIRKAIQCVHMWRGGGVGAQ